jgi:hypothetical protein
MKAERERFDRAKRSTSARTSVESVIEVFSFIPPLYYQRSMSPYRIPGEKSWSFPPYAYDEPGLVLVHER